MRFKHFLAFLIIFLLAFGGIYGCGKKQPPKSETVISEGVKKGSFDWTKEYVDKLIQTNVVKEDEVKDILREVKRGEFLKWLVTAKGLQIVSEGYEFKDVPKDNPYHDYIITAAVNDIISKEENFKPDDSLVRYVAATWLVNAWGEKAKVEAAKYTEPLIPAQDAYDDIPPEAIGPMTICYLPEYQMLYYRYKEGDELRYCMPKDMMRVGEACHSIYMLAHPPQRGGTLIIGQAQEPKTLFTGADTMSAMSQITSLLYEGTIGGWDENWCLYPIMAKRVPTQENGLWKLYDDGRMEVTYELRKDLKWSDGTPITSEDYVFAFYLFNHPSFPTVHSQVDKWIDKVEAVDEHTIKVYWNHHYLYANYGISVMPKKWFTEKFNYELKPYNLNDPKYYVEDNPDTPQNETYKSDQYKKDEEFIRKAVESEYKEKPFHCGAYKVKNWLKGQTITLEANENYLFGKPLIETIIFRTIESTDTLLASALAGNVDMTLVGLTFDQAQQIAKDPNSSHKAVFTPSLTWEHIDLTLTDKDGNPYPGLSEVNVRKALLYAIDRQAIVDQLFGGLQPVSNSWLPPKHPAYDETNIAKYEYDPEKAKQLLDEAGWKLNPSTGKREKDGKVLSVIYSTTSGNKTREQVQAVISDQWKQIGVDVVTKNEQATSFFGDTLQKRQFAGPSAFMYAWVMGPTSNLFSIVNSTQIPTEKNGFTGQNFTGYKNETVDKLTNEIQGLMDKQKIYANLKECQKILTEELPSLPLFTRVDVSSVRKNLQGFKPTGTQTPFTWNTPWWYWEK